MTTAMHTLSKQAFSIRHARVEDAPEIARLSTQLGYPATATDIAARLKRMLDMPTHAVFVVADDDSVCGFVAAEHRLLLECGERVDIVSLVIDAASRRNGAGSALVTAAELWAHKRGVKRLRVRSNIAREESHPFYRALGYEQTKTQHAYAKNLAA